MLACTLFLALRSPHTILCASVDTLLNGGTAARGRDTEDHRECSMRFVGGADGGDHSQCAVCCDHSHCVVIILPVLPSAILSVPWPFSLRCDHLTVP